MRRSTVLALLAILAYLLFAVALAAQRRPEAVLRAFWVVPDAHAIVLTDAMPSGFRFCAEQEGKAFHGCVTARELRDKAAAEKRARKGQP